MINELTIRNLKDTFAEDRTLMDDDEKALSGLLEEE